MEKETRHQKAQNFRQEISLAANRNRCIVALLSKDVFDASDRLRIMILFQKASYLTGCEAAYTMLTNKIIRMNDAELGSKVAAFAKKLNIKPVNINVCLD